MINKNMENESLEAVHSRLQAMNAHAINYFKSCIEFGTGKNRQTFRGGKR